MVAIKLQTQSTKHAHVFSANYANSAILSYFSSDIWMRMRALSSMSSIIDILYNSGFAYSRIGSLSVHTFIRILITLTF